MVSKRHVDNIFPRRKSKREKKTDNERVQGQPIDSGIRRMIRCRYHGFRLGTVMGLEALLYGQSPLLTALAPPRHTPPEHQHRGGGG